MKQAKVILYLDVDDTIDVYSLEKKISGSLAHMNGVYENAPMEVMVDNSEITVHRTDDGKTYAIYHSFESFPENETPVGFILPNGEPMIVKSSDFGLAHLTIGKEVRKRYEELFSDGDIYSHNTEDWLERKGVIKVHDWDVYYYAHLSRSGYYNEAPTYTPYVTEEQRQTLIDYGHTFHEGILFINSRRVNCGDLLQYDKIALRKLFEL